MDSRDRVSALRWTLLALLLALPAAVVCKPTGCFEDSCSELGAPDPAAYETNFGCDGGDVVVTAGTASDSAGENECFDIVEASATDLIDGVAAQVEFLAQHGGSTVTLTCAYEIGADLPQALTCTGDTLRPAQFFYNYGSGIDPVALEISALRTSLADGSDTGAFDPRIFITCPGEDETEIVADAGEYTTPELPLNNSDCAVRVEMNSSAMAAGATYHSVTLSVSGSGSCSNDAECPAGLRCHDGVCQDGGVGDACSSSHLPNGSGDCSAAAPHCVTAPGLVAPRCSDGADGRACAGDFHCTDATCIEIFPGLGVCQDGSTGDLCMADADCQAGCSCLLGGSRGNCVGACPLLPGELGASCTAAFDCSLPLGCVDVGSGVSTCAPCSLDEHCATESGEVCQTGECGPGS